MKLHVFSAYISTIDEGRIVHTGLKRLHSVFFDVMYFCAFEDRQGPIPSSVIWACVTRECPIKMGNITVLINQLLILVRSNNLFS